MKIKEKDNLYKLILSAMFLAMGILLPLLTAQIKEIGNMLLPMHLVIMLCGFICGWKWGLITGFILPFLRSILFGMPPLFPNALWMAAELATYGFVTGFLYPKNEKQKIGWIYFCLISSMLLGRCVWAAVKWLLLFANGKAFTFQMFLADGFISAVPGIVIQLILIPVILSAIKKNNIFLKTIDKN